MISRALIEMGKDDLPPGDEEGASLNPDIALVKIVVLERQLADKDPVRSALLVEPQLHTLDAAVLAGEQALIIPHIAGGHRVRGHIKVC